MTETVVKHPEVDENLYVAECVVRVGCPVCKMKAGMPCKGQRFKWLAQGSRRGFRYVQGTHYPRRNLFQLWKSAGRPHRLPADVTKRLVATWGKFPQTVDWKAVVSALPQSIRTAKAKKAVAKKAVAKKAVAKRSKTGRASTLRPIVRVEHRSTIWEGMEGNGLWSWCPYIEYGDYTHASVFDIPPYGVTLRFEGHEHKCESREAAFDLAIELVTKAALLCLFNERAEWRVRELERRFGHMMKETDDAEPTT